ncbi:MAG: hypothetical protein FWD65_02880 [Coriobacteriia bacterium]|nr:hypothetical protein [Coriobacteriia bacterium]
MKKAVILPALITLLILLIAGCALNANSNPNSSQLSSSTNVKAEPWQNAYAEFLKGFPALTDYDFSTFSLRDLDNDSVPELIIIQGKEDEQIKTLSVYSYNGLLLKLANAMIQTHMQVHSVSQRARYFPDCFLLDGMEV